MTENDEIYEGNGYQILVEGTADLIIKSQTENMQYNYSSLIRDLYNKIYALSAKVKDLTAQLENIPTKDIPTKDISTQTGAGP
jgi:hypothetical protein